MEVVQIHDKRFSEMISKETISARITEMAAAISSELEGKDVVFVGILNGAFMFAADLFRQITIPARISFVKLASYRGTSSSGTIKELIGWNEDLRDKTVVVIEDIVDTGNTLERIVDEIMVRKAETVLIAALLFKPEAYLKNIALDYIGFEIPNDFVVGFGLDYDGLGRNLPSIFTLIK